MLEICGHANWDAGRNHPLPEPERLFWRNAWTAVHGAVAEAMTQYQSTDYNNNIAMKNVKGKYRRPSLINACKYATFSSWAQVGFFSG